MDIAEVNPHQLAPSVENLGARVMNSSVSSILPSSTATIIVGLSILAPSFLFRTHPPFFRTATTSNRRWIWQSEALAFASGLRALFAFWV
jgi:hypothetical protein